MTELNPCIDPSEIGVGMGKFTMYSSKVECYLFFPMKCGFIFFEHTIVPCVLEFLNTKLIVVPSQLYINVGLTIVQKHKEEMMIFILILSYRFSSR